MRILITSIIDLKKSAHNSRLHQFLKQLSSRHEITVLSINDWWKAEQDIESSNYFHDFDCLFDKINIIYFTEKKISPILQELYSVKVVNNITKKLDFDIHFNYNSLTSGYSVTRSANSMRINTVYDIADDLPEMIRTSPQIPSSLKTVGGIFGNQVMRKNIEVSKMITYTAESLRASCGIPKNKSKIIPNGVDTNLFRKYSKYIGDDINICLPIDNSFIIGYVGLIREWVDLEPLFIAIDKLSSNYDIKLLIVGGGAEYTRNLRLANKYSLLNKSIFFTGTISYNDVPKYISIMDVCVIPFKLNKVSQNSLPLKLFEYMSCEKPIISTKIKGVFDLVGDMVLYASNYQEYIDKIIELYNNADLAKKFGADGRRFVELNYDWENIALQLENILLKESS
jgi:glycosyltransferase involved in cell wall biosynthesis